MKKYESHYGEFNVMNEKDHWDEETRVIVEKRMASDLKIDGDQQLLLDICSILLDDTRPSVLQFVVSHFQTKLASKIGEGQRKKGIPKESILIGEGLRALQTFCLQHYNQIFHELSVDEKKSVVKKLAEGSIQLSIGNLSIPSQDFFKKLLSEAVSACYSHPDVWSEIGYAGPAYPRGYVRTELGLVDPWEAKRDEK